MEAIKRIARVVNMFEILRNKFQEFSLELSRSGAYKSKVDTEGEAGAAALELAMAIPLVIMLCAIGLNVATYFGYTAKVDTVASVAARYVMNHSSETPTSANLTRELSAQFPELNNGSNSLNVRVEAYGSASEELTYPLFSEGEFQNLKTNIGSKTYCITVSTSQVWPALGFLFSDSDGKFNVSSSRLCEVDKIQDSKWIQE